MQEAKIIYDWFFKKSVKHKSLSLNFKSDTYFRNTNILIETYFHTKRGIIDLEFLPYQI